MRAFVVVALVACSSQETAVAPADASSSDTAVVDTHVGHPVEDARPEVDARVVEPPAVPPTLAETGLYADFAARTLAPGVMPFDVRYPLWSDGADKARFLFIPAGKQIDTSDMDHWSFPVGTKAWKEFRRDGVLIETRYFEKSGEEPIGWKYVAYVWSADGVTAKAAPLGVNNALGTAHDVPSQEQCEQCHSGARDGLIGLGAIQLSRASGKSPLSLLAEKGLLSKPSADVSPPGASTVQDALGYLHGNCGYCHSDEGRWASARALRLRVRVSDTTPESTAIYTSTINVKMAHADVSGKPYIGVVPGDPAASHLYDRMIKRDFWAMPPVGSEIVDTAGADLIKTWIESLPK